MDRSAQNIDRSSESEVMNLRWWKYAFDVSPLEIIHDEDLIIDSCADINQINLLIHAINHSMIFQYWSLKSDQQQLNSSSCHDQRHRDHHHLRDDDDDEDMIMITCEQPYPTKTADIVIILDPGVFSSNYEDDDDHSHQKVSVPAVIIKEDVDKDADDYIMSQLNVVDAFYELEWIGTSKQLEEVKKCIIQRISEAKLAVKLAKPKTVRIRVDLSVSQRRYYANPAAAASAHAEAELYYRTTVDEAFAIHYPVPAVPIKYDDDVSTPALRSSQEALETKIFKEEDLISSSSSCGCSLCSKEFLVGVDVTKKMPCSHVFHSLCLANWLFTTNTCPLCHYELPTFESRFLEDQLP